MLKFYLRHDIGYKIYRLFFLKSTFGSSMNDISLKNLLLLRFRKELSCIYLNITHYNNNNN